MFRKFTILFLIALFVVSTSGLPLIIHNCKMSGITFEEPKCSACVHKVNAKELSKIIFTSNNKCCQQFVIDKNIVEKYIASYKLNITEDILISDIILSDEVAFKEFQPLTNTLLNISDNNLYIKNSVLLI